MHDWTMLSYITAIAIMVIILGTALVVLWLIFTGKINLANMLDEPGPAGAASSTASKASLSRFQFLLFTFVVAGLFLLLSIESGTFVNIPASVLELIGISAATYGVSKGITAGANGNAAVATKAAATARQAATDAQGHADTAQANADTALVHATSAKAVVDSVRP